MTTKPRLFVSYGREDDEPFVWELYNELTKVHGFDVWFDRVNMPSRGFTFLEEIRDAIDERDRLLFVVGPYALRDGDNYVRPEWMHALNTCKIVVPVLRLGDFSSIPTELKLQHAVDMRKERALPDAMSELLRVLDDPEKPLGRLYNVPRLPTWYVSREDALSEVVAAVRVDGVKPIAITSKQQTVSLQGVGGVGKTTLAAALCYSCEIRRTFPDGIFWVELGQNPSVAARQADIGVLLGDTRDNYPDITSGKARLDHFLSTRAALIVLDDAWDKAHAEAFITSNTRSRILLTTRNPKLLTQLGITSQKVDALTVEQAVAIMLERAPGGDESLYADIANKLNRHALAVSLAGAWLADHGVEAAQRFLERLRKGQLFDLLNLDDGKGDKNDDLELCLRISFDDLKSDDLRRRFRALGAFAGEATFDEQAAQIVFDDEDTDETDDTLTNLTKAGLLTRDGDRYSHHPLLRTYARALAEHKGELLEFEGRHFDCYRTRFADLDRNNDESTHRAITLEFDQIRAALVWANVYEAEQSTDLLWALNHFTQLHVPHNQRLALFTAGYTAAEQSGYVIGLARMSLILGELKNREEKLEEAHVYLEESKEFYEFAGYEYETEALSLYLDLAFLYLLESDFEQAQISCRKAIELSWQRDRLTFTNAHTMMGNILREMAHWEPAKFHYETALHYVRFNPSNQIGLANALYGVGFASIMTDQLADAEQYLTEALALYRRIGSTLGEMHTLGELAILHAVRGETDKACQKFRKFIAILETKSEHKNSKYVRNRLAAFQGLGCSENGSS